MQDTNSEEKKTLDKKFDMLSVINKTYADSSEYDLNDTLIYLSKSISQTKLKNKDLVKSNFSKFVECRIVLEEILEDIRNKGLDKDFSSDIFVNIKYVKSKFKKVNREDDTNRERKIIIMNKYKTLFNIKALLQSNINNAERFTDIYKQGKIQYEEVKNSKFIQNIWESIKDIRIAFLERLYNQIINEDKNYMEILYVFDLYFQIDENKTDRKIMNTLLVNFKEKCLDIPFQNKGIFLKEINYFFLKTIVHLDKELQKEAVIHLFKKIKIIFSRSKYEFIKIWLIRYKILLPDDLDLEVRSVYTVNLKSLKKDVIYNLLDRDNLYEMYKKIEELLENDEIYLLNQRLLQVIEDEAKKINLDNSEMIKKYFDELDKFDEYLKDDRDDFYDLKRRILNTELKKQIKELSTFLIKNQNKQKKLMEILRVVDKLPNFYEIILKGVLPILENDKCLFYYVAHILKIESPSLNMQQENEVDSLKRQFGFLINTCFE
jgi:hypothetical protein